MTNSLAMGLSYISGIVAAIGILAYFGAIFRPPRYVRLVNGSGLMLCALGLGEVASFGGRLGGATFAFNVELAEVFLIFSVLVQAWASLRRRKAWNGQDRRAATTPERRGSDRRGPDRRDGDRRSGQPDPSFDVADRRQSDRRDASERRSGPRRQDPGPDES